MIIFHLSEIDNVSARFPEFKTALEWLKIHYNDEFCTSTHAISPGVDAKFELAIFKDSGHTKLEAHREFIDIHIPLTEDETIGWAPLLELKSVSVPYNPMYDIEFYADPYREITVRPGEAAIFFPSDAHAPNIGNGGYHKKIIIKIATDPVKFEEYPVI